MPLFYIAHRIFHFPAANTLPVPFKKRLVQSLAYFP